MATFDLDSLLAPLKGSPCGPDLRGEPDFRDIEDAPGGFANKKPAELKQTVDACLAFLGRSKDQMPAIVLAQATLRTADLAATADALRLIKGYADSYWEDFHPAPAEDMLVGRINELSALTRPAAMILPLQRLALAKAAQLEFNAQMVAQACQPAPEWGDNDEEAIKAQVESGQLTAHVARSMRPTHEGSRALRMIARALSVAERDADNAAGTSIDDSRDPTQARGQALEVRSQIAAAREALGTISDLLYEIVEVYQSKGGDTPGFGPVLSQLKAMTSECDRFLTTFSETEDGGPAEASRDPPNTGGDGIPGPGARAPKTFTAGTPRNRDDVAAALDAIVRYYTEAEPSSPVPVILKRVRGWVHKDFMQLIREIAPNGLDEVRRLLASPEE